MLRGKIVCVTTFRQGDAKNLIDKTRTEVFLDTAGQMHSTGLPLVVVYVDTQPRLLKTLRQITVTLIRQRTVGMGNIRREALIAALTHFPSAEYLCWLEPEKPHLVSFIQPMVEKMKNEHAELGMFNRIEMTSYPTEQAHYYLFCRAVASHLLGFDLDYAFGPMVFTSAVGRYFLEYRGDYGDRWDCILVPRLRILKDGHRLTTFPVPFQNDKRMKRVESGNPTIILKRVEQLNNVVPSLIAEWQRLSHA